MSTAGGTVRGRPVAFFAALVIGWTGLRLLTFEVPWHVQPLEVAEAIPQSLRIMTGSPVAVEANSPSVMPPPPLVPPNLPLAMPDLAQVQIPEAPATVSAPEPLGHGRTATEESPVPHRIVEAFEEHHRNAPTRPPVVRWRVDGWLVLRDRGARLSPAGSLAPSYGASQIGAVVAFNLVPTSRRRPSAYIRASHALVHQGESEVALGLSARPIASLPITAHAEMRATRRPEDTELRPSAFLSGGADDVQLPLNLVGRGYAQAGYVGGDYATAFVDGQLVAEREVALLGRSAVNAGAGVWGGAQKDATRLDVGPAASLDVPLGAAFMRVSLDYRQRIAGDAAPASGAALTLSTGF